MIDSKMLKKISRKLRYCESLLLKNENISFSQYPTSSVFIGNGGFECGLTRVELAHAFEAYGQIQKIVMLPKRSYSFVTFSNTEQASSAVAALNGLKLKSGCTFYLAFVKDEDAPKEVSLKSDWPKGLVLLEDFVTEDEEAELLTEINKDDDCNDESLLKHRKVKHYGFEFIYGSNNIDKNRPLESKIPGVCIPHLQKLVSSGYLSRLPDQLTVNHYLPGQGIPPHVDTHSAFEDGIVSLSLSSQVVMNFYSVHGEIVSVTLPRRSLLIMLGESRYLWRHGITPRKQDITACKTTGQLTLVPRSTRISLTFRLVREGACDCGYEGYCDSS